MNCIKFLFSVLLISCFACGASAKTDLIPLPQKVTWGKGNYVMKKSVTIAYVDPQLKPAAAYLAQNLAAQSGVSCKVASSRKGDIRLTLRDGKKSGGYLLTIDRFGILVSGNDYNGVINGIGTIRQMALQHSFPYVSIQDEPRFQWRGFMLDCSRHFFSKQEVEQLINLMAMYKFDRFHWHLTDDQGWRIEIKKYPLLTAKGAWRKYNNQDSICLRRASQEDNPDFLLPNDKKKVEQGDTLYGGYYTQDDIREIVAYAKQRGIEIIPEIDMPGHFLSGVSNYQGLSCFNTVGWGQTFSSPICPGKDSALEFCKNVWKEVTALFPYQYVHIGGDEVEKDNWKKCPDCQKRIKDNHLKDEMELQSWFIHQMEHTINSLGKKMIGWDEIIEGGLSKTSTISWWRGWVPDAVSKATSYGNDAIFCPTSISYLDYAESPDHLNNIYTFDFQSDRLSAAQKEHVLGVQGNLWTEWVPTYDRMMYHYFPRMLAMAELAWTDPQHKDFTDFRRRVRKQLLSLHQLGVSYHVPSITGMNTVTAFTDQATLHVSCDDPLAVIRYTTDGTFPNTSSAKYEKPIKVDETTHFILRTFTPEGKGGELVKADFIKQGYLESMKVQPSRTGLTTAWHDFPGVKCALISQAPLKGNYSIPDVMIPEGVKGNIGLVIRGYIKVPKDGVYTFALKSDDGSWLKIDGNMVVDNDREQSPHEEICGQALKAGFHRIEVRYFDHNGGMLRLNVFNQEGKQLLPAELYFN